MNRFGIENEMIEVVLAFKGNGEFKYIDEAYALDPENKYSKKFPMIHDTEKNVVMGGPENSTDITEYINTNFNNGNAEFGSPELIADARAADKSIFPHWLGCLMKKTQEEKDEQWKLLNQGLENFTKNVKPDGFFKGSQLTAVDVVVFTWVWRMFIIEGIGGYRLDDKLPWVSDLNAWLDRVSQLPEVKSTFEDKDKLMAQMRLDFFDERSPLLTYA